MAEDSSSAQPGPSTSAVSNPQENVPQDETKVKEPSTAEAKDEASSSTSRDKELDVAQTALNLLTQGRRHLLVSDIPLAVQTLEEACQLLAQQYGDMGPECADAYFYYGSALLEMSRMESDVLGPGMEADKTEEKDDDDESEEEDEAENEAEKAEEDEESPEDDQPQDKGKSIAEPNVIIPQNKSAKEGDEKSDDEEEKEEELSNLQLAWETLDAAKVIFKRQSESDASFKPRLADTLLRLAEVSIESENFQAAIEDLLECLNIQTQIYPADSRNLAETRYQLGIAYSFASEFDVAITHFKAAVQVIEDRIGNLKKKIEDKKNGVAQPEEDSANRSPFYTEEGELEELTSLLPDIQSKVNDTEDMKREAKRNLQEQVMGLGSFNDGASTSKANGDLPSTSAASSSSSVSPSAAAKPVSNISHLVKKKRKPEEEETEKSKKAKLDEETEKKE